MKTRCPNCRTVFRITTDQIRRRAGRVRCGRCRVVFNALDDLLDESLDSLLVSLPVDGPLSAMTLQPDLSPETTTDSFEKMLASFPGDVPLGAMTLQPDLSPETTADSFTKSKVGELPAVATPEKKTAVPVPITVADKARVSRHHAKAIASASETRERDKTIRRILSGDERKTSGNRRRSKRRMIDFPLHWSFSFLLVFLTLLLAGQAVFHYRGELAVSFPKQKQALEAFSLFFNSSLPLPAKTELVSIETSDLQTDTVHNLLVLNATLRNRAPYGQRYPSLELSLTDTGDTPIIRRIFSPEEYLPPTLSANQPFSANSDVAVRLWIEINQIGATGYRLSIFYL